MQFIAIWALTAALFAVATITILAGVLALMRRAKMPSLFWLTSVVIIEMLSLIVVGYAFIVGYVEPSLGMTVAAPLGAMYRAIVYGAAAGAAVGGILYAALHRLILRGTGASAKP
jgi:hypothetical protein